ncbi:MAG: zinc ribbon domain-containing protein [Ruthenibacterium lactatiformans]
MECRYCGQRLKDGYEYCPNCGGRVEPPEQQARPVQPAYAPQGAYSAPVQGYSQQEAEGCVYGMLQPGAGLGRVVSPYYARIATSLRAEEAAQCGAFFLGPFHQLYRGCYKRFARTYLPYWLALLAVLGVSLSFFGKLCVELAGYGGRAAEPTQAFFVWIAAILLLSLGVSVWGIALSIYNGVTFNRRYFEQQHGDPAVPAHTGAVVGGAAAWVGVYIIAVVALVAALLPAAMQDAQQHQAPGTLPYAQSVPQALPDDNATYGTEHYGAAVSDALEAHWGEGSDQALLNGYIPAQAAGGTLEERLRGSHLFYSDARTLDELFAAAEDVQWYTDYEPDADGTEYADASWIMGDTVLVCVFAVSDTYTWVVDFYSYRNGEDPTADGCYTFWDEERSALLLELYGENAPEEPSLARQMRGAWVDGAGGAVLLDESFFDGTDYTLGTMMDGGVQCWVQDDGSYIVFVLDETGNALTARWYDGSGTLRAEQSFTRGTPG